VSLETKTIVRDAKRTYAGIYMAEGDQDKVFWPLVKTHIDSITGNLDYDTGDIRIVSKSNKYKGTAYLLSELLRCKLRENNFGRLMNETAKELALSGTVVVRTINEKGPKSYLIDLENFWTDFNTDTPSWFAERVPMLKLNIPKSWKKDMISKESSSKFKETGDRIHDDTVIAYRVEGVMPLGWINGTNDESEVYGLLWITGMEDGTPYIQSRKILGKDLTACSYDFAQFVPNQNRFISVGVAEGLNHLQKYMNLVINNRIQRSNLASTGILEIRKGSGITPRDVNDLVAGGALVVSQIGTDIKSTPVQDVSQVSFNEEQSIAGTANNLTGSTEISRGQVNRSGTTLGQANLEAGYSSQRFQFHREALGFLFEAVLHKWLTMIVKEMDKEEVVHIADEAILRELAGEQAKYDRNMMANMAQQQLGDVAGMQIANDEQMLQKMTEDRIKQNEWTIIKQNLKDFDYMIEISVNSESKDLNAIANNIVATLPILAQMPNGAEALQPMVDKLFEVLGISSYNVK
jgi:hypothetical protein